MLKTEKTSVFNFENAIRGARNPMNSWDRMDSRVDENGKYVLGENDLALARKLRAAGGTHRKFMRQIFVSVDITAPLYWWKEFDTYKVGTVANSTSTMHKIHSKPFELDDFSHEKLDETSLTLTRLTLARLEELRLRFTAKKDKADWYNIIQLLPSGYNQLRTCTLNYENLVGMYADRKNHKLDEWRALCQWIESLPYAKELIIGE